MTKINFKARIKRNNLEELAGEYFIDENSALIKILNSNGKNTIVGIQNALGLYTVIGYEKIYYSTHSCIGNEIFVNDFLSILTRTAMKNGKFHNYEFIEVEDNNSVWVMNIQTMNALWNTILLLDTRVK